MALPSSGILRLAALVGADGEVRSKASSNTLDGESASSRLCAVVVLHRTLKIARGSRPVLSARGVGERRYSPHIVCDTAANAASKFAAFCPHGSAQVGCPAAIGSMQLVRFSDTIEAHSMFLAS